MGLEILFFGLNIPYVKDTLSIPEVCTVFKLTLCLLIWFCFRVSRVHVSINDTVQSSLSVKKRQSVFYTLWGLLPASESRCPQIVWSADKAPSQSVSRFMKLEIFMESSTYHCGEFQWNTTCKTHKIALIHCKQRIICYFKFIIFSLCTLLHICFTSPLHLTSVLCLHAWIHLQWWTCFIPQLLFLSHHEKHWKTSAHTFLQAADQPFLVPGSRLHSGPVGPCGRAMLLCSIRFSHCGWWTADYAGNRGNVSLYTPMGDMWAHKMWGPSLFVSMQ